MSEFVDASGKVTPGAAWEGGDASPASAKHRWLKWTILTVVILLVLGGMTVFMRMMTVSYGIWSGSVKPKVAASSDTQAVELGLKFQTAVSGKVTGVSFYKGPGNDGTHTGSLWDKYGVKLASVTFSHESASGWQTAYFKQPVSIAGNVTYVISYFAPKGHNAVDVNYFNKAFVNKRITALNNGWDGGDGLFTFAGSSSFPLHSSQASNYWVEPIFSSKVFGASVAPSAPVSFQAVPSGKSVQLSWLPSVSSRPIKQYEVYRDGQLIKTISGTAPSVATANHTATTTVARLNAVVAPTVAMTLGTGSGADTISLASTTTVNNSANNTATDPNSVSSTKTTTTVNTSDSGTTTTDPTTTTPAATDTTAPTTTTTPTDGSDQYTYTDTNVDPGVTYNYQVKAVDTADQSSDVSKTKTTVGGNGVAPSTTPSTTSQNGGITTVNNNANNTATDPNSVSSTKTTTNVSNSGGTTTPTTTGSTTPTTTTAPSSGTTKTTGTGGTTTGTSSSLGNTATGANQQSSSSAIWQYSNDTTDWSQYFNSQFDFNVNGTGTGTGSTGGSGSGSGTNVTNSNTGDVTKTTTTTTGNTTTVNNSSSSSAH